MTRKKGTLRGMKIQRPKGYGENPVPRREDSGVVDGKYQEILPKLSEQARASLEGKVAQPTPEVLPDLRRPVSFGSWAQTIREELDEKGLLGRPVRTEMVRKVIELARAGVPWAIQFLADREDGKPRQALGLEGADGGELTVNLVRFGEGDAS